VVQINLVQPKDYNLVPDIGSGLLRFYVREEVGGRLIADITVRRGWTTDAQYRRKVGHWQHAV
jgi:hypothetical protein